MIDHRAVVGSLTPQQRLHLTTKSDGAGLRHFAFHGGAIILFGALIAARVPFWPLLMVPQGIVIVFLFTLLHETVHRTAFKTRALNDIVAGICALMIALPVEWFRAFHFAHHRFTQDPENDPELAGPKPETPKQYFVHLSGLPTWYGHFKILALNGLGRCGDGFVSADRREAVKAEARIMIAVYAALAGISFLTGSTVLFYAWILPALIGQPALRLYLLAEHTGCPKVMNVLENTRTVLTNRLIRRIAWNMPYHTEHHTFPAVPFHRLPDLHEVMAGRIRHIEPGYSTFHRRLYTSLASR
jgi:fatty acid desaturase